MAARPRLPPLHQALDFDSQPDCFDRPNPLRSSRSTFQLQSSSSTRRYADFSLDRPSQSSFPPFDPFASGPPRSRSSMQLRAPLPSLPSIGQAPINERLGSPSLTSSRQAQKPLLPPLSRPRTPTGLSGSSESLLDRTSFGNLDEGFGYSDPSMSGSSLSRPGTPSLGMEWEPSRSALPSPSSCQDLYGHRAQSPSSSPRSVPAPLRLPNRPRRPASDPSIRSPLSPVPCSPLDRTFQFDVNDLPPLPPVPQQTGSSLYESRIPLPQPRAGPSVSALDFDSLSFGRERNAYGWEPGTGPSDGDWIAALDGSGSRVYPCSFCGKIFPRPSARKVHLVVHTGERPFVCTTCGKGFAVASNMRRHMRIHDKQMLEGNSES